MARNSPRTFHWCIALTLVGALLALDGPTRAQPPDGRKAVLTGRLDEIKRRVDAFQSDVKSWFESVPKDLDEKAHASQLKYLQVLALTGFQPILKAQLKQLRATNGNPSAGLKELSVYIFRANRFWHYFRGMFELNASPSYRESLWLANTVGWNCYAPVIEQAV